MTEPLRIHLLGPFEILREEHPITNQDWRSQQTRTICKILLARRGQVVTSDQIIEILWPDDSPESARRRLHVRISQLRNALGSGKSLLQTVDGGYLFSPDETCWLDVDAFQTRIADGFRYQEVGQQPQAIRAYEQARQLYRGDFLAEDLYTDWTFAGREFYRERFLILLIELSECYAQQGRYRLAIARAQEALARDPLRETIYVRLMLYHYYAGERTQALRVFEHCCQVLAAELSVAPLDSTIHLEEQIRAGTLWGNADAPRYPPPIYEGRLFEVPYILSETPLVGRKREYAWLVEQWQDKAQRVILLEGEAGIGKSRLVEAFAGYIASRGTRVLRARVSPTKQAPFAPLITALHPLLTSSALAKLTPTTLAALALLFPEINALLDDLPRLPKLPSDGERQRLYQAISALAAVCASPPTLLLVDDAHRLGAASAEMLARLTDSFQILLSFRSEETSSEHPIRTVLRGTTRLLEPLTPDGVQTLIRQLAGQELPEIAAEISAQTGGNPLFVVALLQHMFETGQLYVDAGGGWGLALDEALSLPPTVRETIEARLRRLNRAQRRILDLAAVLGGEFDFALLRTASQQPEDDLLSTLDELMDVALITEPRSLGRGEFAIAHDRYTEVVYATLPNVRRKQMHRQAAQAIEGLYSENLSTYFPALADHYGKAENPECEAHYAALAGEQAVAQFSHATALRYLSRALALTSPDEIAARVRLLLAREKVYDLLGDRQPQKDDLDALNALSVHLDTRQRAEISLRQAAYGWILEKDALAQAAIAQTIALAQACGAADLEAGAYLLKARAATDQSLARQDLGQARTLAQQDDLRPLEGDIVRCLGNACFWQSNYAESKAYFEEALAIHREVGDLRGELSVLNNLGVMSQLLGELQTSAVFYEQALDICHKIGDRLAEGVLLTNLGDLTAQLGKYQQAQNWLEQALVIRDQIGNEEGVGMLLNSLGDATRQQGQYALAKAHYERALEINTRIQHPEQTCDSLNSLSTLYRELGDTARAQAYFEQALNTLAKNDSPNRLRALANGSLLQHVLGEHSAALEMGLRVISQSRELPSIQAAALTNVGLASLGLQRYAEAGAYFRQALDIRQNLRQPHLAAEPLAGLAQLSLAENNLPEALVNVAQILLIRENGALQGPDRLLWVYLTCYQVLQRCQDERAENILQGAESLLQARAAIIADDELRRAFLGVVPENREITRFL
jgi:DNA-binding SARP family transcriptional activator/Tfp pilus assembly protein PilF